MTPQQLKELEDNLWEAAPTLRNSSGLKSNEYSTPILGIVFLRYIETLYAAHATEIEAIFEAKKGKRDEVPIEKIAITSCGFYQPPHARYDYLKNGEFKPQGKTTREALQEAMRSAEAFNDMPDTLPEELVVFDFLDKPKLTPNEKEKVKTTARTLLSRLKEEKENLLVPDWHRDNITKLQVEMVINHILHEHLLESYDKPIFEEKKRVVLSSLIEGQAMKYF